MQMSAKKEEYEFGTRKESMDLYIEVVANQIQEDR